MKCRIIRLFTKQDQTNFDLEVLKCVLLTLFEWNRIFWPSTAQTLCFSWTWIKTFYLMYNNCIFLWSLYTSPGLDCGLCLLGFPKSLSFIVRSSLLWNWTSWKCALGNLIQEDWSAQQKDGTPKAPQVPQMRLKTKAFSSVWAWNNTAQF